MLYFCRSSISAIGLQINRFGDGAVSIRIICPATLCSNEGKFLMCDGGVKPSRGKIPLTLSRSLRLPNPATPAQEKSRRDFLLTLRHSRAREINGTGKCQNKDIIKTLKPSEISLFWFLCFSTLALLGAATCFIYRVNESTLFIPSFMNTVPAQKSMRTPKFARTSSSSSRCSADASP